MMFISFVRMLILHSVYLPRSLGPRTNFLAVRPSLPTIKSEQDGSASPVNGTIKVEGGVPLDTDEAKKRPATPSASQSEPTVVTTATADQK